MFQYWEKSLLVALLTFCVYHVSNPVCKALKSPTKWYLIPLKKSLPLWKSGFFGKKSAAFQFQKETQNWWRVIFGKKNTFTPLKAILKKTGGRKICRKVADPLAILCNPLKSPANGRKVSRTGGGGVEVPMSLCIKIGYTEPIWA